MCQAQRMYWQPWKRTLHQSYELQPDPNTKSSALAVCDVFFNHNIANHLVYFMSRWLSVSSSFCCASEMVHPDGIANQCKWLAFEAKQISSFFGINVKTTTDYSVSDWLIWYSIRLALAPIRINRKFMFHKMHMHPIPHPWNSTF